MTRELQNKFYISIFKNKIKQGRLICPICGEKVIRLSKRNQFINSPAGIYLIFSTNLCKKKFITLINEDNSEWNIRNIIEHTPNF